MNWRRLFDRTPRPASSAGAWLDAGGASRLGPRDENQDRWLLRPDFGLVSDGMGGHRGGATAADATVAGARAALDDARSAGRAGDPEALQAAFRRANDEVRRAREAQPDLAQMGATLTVALLVDRDGDSSRWLVANVGDSPAFLAQPARTTRLSTDDTVPGRLLREGVITEAEAVAHPYRHMVLHAIGVEADVEADISGVELTAGDAIVLTSDGLSDVLEVDEIGRLALAGASAVDAAAALADAAIASGASDNVTAVVLRHVASSVRVRPGT